MSQAQSALLTDLYQLTMLQAYFDERMAAEMARLPSELRLLAPSRTP